MFLLGHNQKGKKHTQIKRQARYAEWTALAQTGCHSNTQTEYSSKIWFFPFFFNLKKNRKKKEKLLFSHVTVLLETIDKRT